MQVQPPARVVVRVAAGQRIIVVIGSAISKVFISYHRARICRLRRCRTWRRSTSTYRTRHRRNLLRSRLRADSGTVVEVRIMSSSRASMHTPRIMTATAFLYSTYLRLPRSCCVPIPAKNSCARTRSVSTAALGTHTLLIFRKAASARCLPHS
jgi:hypothetical protein